MDAVGAVVRDAAFVSVRAAVFGRVGFAEVAGVATGVFRAVDAVTGLTGSGMPGERQDPGDPQSWLLVTEEGWGNVVYHQFATESQARSAFNRLTMPRVLYDPPRREVDWGGHPSGCTTIRQRIARETPSFVAGAWMVMTEDGPGNVRFFPFESESTAAEFFAKVFRARLMVDPTMAERRSGGWNPFAIRTLRERLSQASVPSAVASLDGPQCFVPGTLLLSVSGARVPVEQLTTDSRIRSANGRDLRVMKIVVHEASAQKPAHLMEISVELATITVTATHRIPTLGGIVEAADLSEGSIVLVSGGEPAKVTHVRAWSEPCAVYELTFDSDEAVEAFVEPAVQILSMGQERRRTRRSGMNQRLQRQQAAAGGSIPDTAWSEDIFLGAA